MNWTWEVGAVPDGNGWGVPQISAWSASGSGDGR